jgi:hypothetical protein
VKYSGDIMNNLEGSGQQRVETGNNQVLLMGYLVGHEIQKESRDGGRRGVDPASLVRDELYHTHAHVRTHRK